MKYTILFLLGVLAPLINSEENGDVLLEKFLESFKGDLNRITRNIQLPEDVGLNISDFLHKYDYPFESHEVTTDDGFIITLHRIPTGRNQTVQTTTDTAKPAALFVAGLTCSSIDWVNLGPDSALGLLMADLGYDIWLLNTRGTRYSMKHTTLNSSEAAFWAFSFHEKGYYDIATSIDYILSSTGLTKITLIGHSEGTSGSMALTTTRPEYNDKLNLVVLLSPIGYMGGVTSPLPLLLVKYMTELQLIFDALKVYGLPYTEWVAKAITSLASIDGVPDIFANFLQLLCGYDSDQIDLDFVVVFVSDKPAGLSIRQLIHYGQEIIAETFRQYDYGAVGNMVHYGAVAPPSYDPSKITAPVAAYYAKNDFFAAIADVENLLGQIPNKADTYLVEYDKFNHLDFVMAKDVKTLLYDRVLATIQQYSPVIN